MIILSDKIVITRKEHMCNACGRFFEAGTKMRTQVNTCDGIQTWRECPTCNKLLSKYRSFFDDGENDLYEFCVLNNLAKEQTPEQLLAFLEKGNAL